MKSSLGFSQISVILVVFGWEIEKNLQRSGIFFKLPNNLRKFCITGPIKVFSTQSAGDVNFFGIPRIFTNSAQMKIFTNFHKNGISHILGFLKKEVANENGIFWAILRRRSCSGKQGNFNESMKS